MRNRIRLGWEGAAACLVLAAVVGMLAFSGTALGGKGGGGKPPKDTTPEPILLVYAQTDSGFFPTAPTFVHTNGSHGWRPVDVLNYIIANGSLLGRDGFTVRGRELPDGPWSEFTYDQILPPGSPLLTLTEELGIKLFDVVDEPDSLGVSIALSIAGGKKTDRYWTNRLEAKIHKAGSLELLHNGNGEVDGFLLHVDADNLTFTKISGSNAGALLTDEDGVPATISIGGLKFLLDTDADGTPDRYEP